MTPVTRGGLPTNQPPSNRNPNQPDAAVVARAMEMLKSQREPTSPPPIRPGISTTAQQSLSLPEGQYVGDVKDGVPHGRGKLTYHPGEERKKYEGQWANGQFHGRGILRFSNGDQFEGPWENGLQHGEGLLTLADGTKYAGRFERGNRHGNGTCQYANGDTYVGDWEDDKFHGKGTYTYANGASYVGDWENDQFHGIGTYKYVNGDTMYTSGQYVGEWRNGERNGQGTHTGTGDNWTYTGEWLDDQWHGQGRHALSVGFGDGAVSEGIFRNNRMWTGTSTARFHPIHTYQDGEDVTNPCKLFCCETLGLACCCSIM